MRLGRIIFGRTAPSEAEQPTVSDLLAKSVEIGKVRAYGDGLSAGVKVTLDQLENHPDALAPGGCYTGPMPDELKRWIERARERHAMSEKDAERQLARAIEELDLGA